MGSDDDATGHRGRSGDGGLVGAGIRTGSGGDDDGSESRLGICVRAGGGIGGVVGGLA